MAKTPVRISSARSSAGSDSDVRSLMTTRVPPPPPVSAQKVSLSVLVRSADAWGAADTAGGVSALPPIMRARDARMLITCPYIQRRSTRLLRPRPAGPRSEEHTSELQSLMRISYAVFCLKTKKNQYINTHLQQLYTQ